MIRRSFFRTASISSAARQDPSAASCRSRETGRFERLLRRKDVDLVAVDAIHAETAEHLYLRLSKPVIVSPVFSSTVVRFVHVRKLSFMFSLFGDVLVIDT